MERQATNIKIKPQPTIAKYSERFETEIGELRGRVDKKRELLAKLNNQKKALSYWMRHNQYFESHSSLNDKKLLFPLIFVQKSFD